ncbi:hypothetical protein EWB00_002188 [Schistosoma japonicum]|uniref:Uncharacterized protein n=1 Tax=Schistosoma japonicum TaxID=6182 RepID=A0A4Z2DDY3_SCHJA|nr:hypothetical protein EWB00_002188 [Schistosoma japonicum]
MYYPFKPITCFTHPTFCHSSLHHSWNIMNGMSIYAVDLLLIICISTVYSARPLTPYQRSFTPTRNISCSQCEMKVETDKSKSFIETDMYRRRCLDEPEIFFKPCIVNDKNRPRGCAKLTTYLKEPTSKGRVKVGLCMANGIHDARFVLFGIVSSRCICIPGVDLWS